MSYDLDAMSREELTELKKDVDTALSTLADRERTAALEAVRKAAAEHGFDIADLAGQLGQKQRGRGKSAKNPAKYRNPNDPTKTWTGRGRKPGWIKEAQAAGTDIADFAV